jgi:hypothetical protein
MKRIIVAIVLMAFIASSAFAQALPVSRMQSAISAAIQQKAIKRGFAQNDPRFGSTLNLVSGTLGSVAGASAAAVVAGAVTAPAWATVASAAGVGALVTAGVTLAVGGLVDWIFPSDPASTTPITQHYNQAQPMGNGLVAGGPYWRTSILSIDGSDAMSVIQTAISLNWVDTATVSYRAGTCTSSTNPTKVSCLVSKVTKATGYEQTGYAAISATYVTSGAVANCQAGYVYKPSSCIPVPSAQPADVALSAQAAINNLSAQELAKPLNPELVAVLADKTWRDAAAQPGYSGLPYLATDPISSTEVDAWRQANPSSWPTVQDYVSPQPSANSPWSMPVNPTATSQNPTSGTSTSTNPAAQSPLVNLGPDPGIGSPALESTPTAQQILQPLLNLFPDFKSLVIPSHQATCPKPSISAFGKTFVLESHCNLAEQVRTPLFSIMAAVWAMTAAFIVLRA